MQPIPATPWLLRCALAAAVLLLADRLATMWIGTGLQQPAITTRENSLGTFERYVGAPTPDIVLVGSSVTWRLKDQYFSHAGIRNLAIAGGSPATGLAIVAGQRSLPRIILIETNILTRGVDQAMVEKFSNGGGAAPLFLRPVRTAIAAYEAWNHAPPGAAEALKARQQLLREPPSDFDNRVYLARALQEMNAGDPASAVRANVKELAQSIAETERRGAQVFLIEIPFSPEIENSKLVRISKEIVHQAFPAPGLWLPIDPPMSELRWADGVHLDERSALLVVQSIEKALADRGDLPAPSGAR